MTRATEQALAKHMNMRDQKRVDRFHRELELQEQDNWAEQIVLRASGLFPRPPMPRE